MRNKLQRGFGILAAAAMLCSMPVPSAAAAGKGSSSKTIIEFRSNGKNDVSAKAGDILPVSVYVPQSTGIHTLTLKMSVNGWATLGVGVNEPEEQLAEIRSRADGEEVEHWLFGNYGIRTQNESFASPYCFDSGHYQAGKAGGNPGLSMAYFLSNTWNISLVLDTFISNNADADAYAPWVAAGKPKKYDNYTPVTTWTKDAAWAYDYALATFELVLPEDLPDGKYDIDVLRGKYINAVSHQWAESVICGESGTVDFETIPLVITVGDVGEIVTETTAPADTTPAEETSAGSVVTTLPEVTTVPETTVPEVTEVSTLPEVTTVPETTLPEETSAGSSATTLPDVTEITPMPEVITVPETTLPEETSAGSSATTLPEVITVPETTLPEETSAGSSATTLPDVTTVPETTVPEETSAGSSATTLPDVTTVPETTLLEETSAGSSATTLPEVTTVPETTPAAEPTTAKRGNFNGDGEINLKDVVLLRRFIAGGWNLLLDPSIADLNGDGLINLKDVVILRRYIAGGWNIVL